MRDTDIFIELIRLSEGIGTVFKATMSHGNCQIAVKDKNGGTAVFTLNKKQEVRKDDQEAKHS